MTTPLTYPFRHESSRGPLRLRLREVFGAEPVDGLWLPHSRDLASEGPALVDEFPTRRGRVDRIAIHPLDWMGPRDDLFTRHGRLKLGELGAEHRGFVLLRLCGARDATVIRLRVRHTPMGPASARLGIAPQR